MLCWNCKSEMTESDVALEIKRYSFGGRVPSDEDKEWFCCNDCNREADACRDFVAECVGEE